MERRLFSSAIYLNISNFPEENGIEESIITINKTSKRKITDTFSEEIPFYPNGKYLIVQVKYYKSLSIYFSSSERQRFKTYLR